MLEQKLAPVLSVLRSVKRKPKQRYQVVKEWFTKHDENLIEGKDIDSIVENMARICTLEDKERQLLTYPVLGNWVLAQMESCKPETLHQQRVYTLMRDLVSELRFKNPHTGLFYDNPGHFTEMEDMLYAALLDNPKESLAAYQFMKDIYKRVIGSLLDPSSEKRLHPRLVRQDYTTDLGHGLQGPIGKFTEHIAIRFDIEMKRDANTPFDLSIMIIDDEEPEKWYLRLLAVGFKEVAGQQGYFFDCETALQALSKGNYDVILSDIEIGDGKMDGIEFAKRAYKIQEGKGKRPLIQVFSYSYDMIDRAQSELSLNKGIVLYPPSRCHKANFTAMDFRTSVHSEIYRPTQ